MSKCERLNKCFKFRYTNFMLMFTQTLLYPNYVNRYVSPQKCNLLIYLYFVKIVFDQI